MTRRWAATILVLPLFAVPLSAHVPNLVTPDDFWKAWSFEPLIVASLAASLWLYVRGVRRLRASVTPTRVISHARAIMFAAGYATVVIALVSPLDSLGGTLLSAHMAQHGLLAGIAPPLLLLGRPGVAFAWGLTGI